MVSGSISPPYSGYFSPFPHGTGSLSVSEECLALADGAARFRRESSGPALLRVSKQALIVPVRGSHPLWPAFPCRSSPINTLKIRPYNPQTAVTVRVWAGPCSLATTYGITIVFFSSGYLDVSVHRVDLRHNRIPQLLGVGCPIRIFTDQRLFAPPRNFSQLITSFIVSESQGIPRTPLLTFF